MPAAAPPPLPDRPDDPLLADVPPDEPPPPYEPVPSTSGEQTLQYGPVRPFQDAPPVPPPQAAYAAPSLPPPPPRRLDSQYTGQSSSSSSWSPPPQPNLPPPSFPFWNGASLTPAQTGYRESYIPPQQYAGPYSAPVSPPPLPPRQPTSPGVAAATPPAPPPLPPPPVGYKPQETPIPGQPYLHEGKLLVYPPGKETCWKCSNTGYKPFDPYTGYRGDDPNHPCRNCWKKYGKPYTSAMRISLENPSNPPPPPNYQRPLRLLQTPATRPVAPNVIGVTSRTPYVPRNPNTIVVRPGDPRIGGVLCRKCGGSGTQMGLFIFDEDTCDMCNGAGRVFV
ncbi:hypothetical protein JCM8115_006674 [Rhodotorula mucilaginosa]|nr:hypothetical protein B0A53_02096 [Rhodotorula sp. CCFEE 5036]